MSTLYSNSIAAPVMDRESAPDTASVASQAGRPDYRQLLGTAAWRRLPAAVRARFSTALGREITYVGLMEKVEANAAGRVLALLCRFVGEPLITHVGRNVPAHVRVYTDRRGGTVWQRAYHFPSRATRLVRSVKRVNTDGELVECLGLGMHMQLSLHEVDGELHFRSTGYYWHAFGVRIPLPTRWFPGETLVVHRDEGNGRFRFILNIDHPLFGRIVHQNGTFEEQEQST